MATLQEIEPIHTRQRVARNSGDDVRLDLDDVKQQASILLRHGLGKYQRMLNAKLLTTLDEAFANWLSVVHAGIMAQLKSIPKTARQQWLLERIYQGDRRRPENQSIRFLVDFLFQHAQRQINDLKRLRTQNQTFRKVIAKVRTQRERQLAILQYAEQVGATQSQLRGDEKAFNRWFDEEAVNDRFEKRVGQQELLLTFLFDRLGEVLTSVFQMVHQFHHEDSEPEASLSDKLIELWQRLGIESRMQQALAYDGDPRIHAAALGCLRRAVSLMPEGLAEQTLDERTLLWLHQIAAEGKADVWVQCEALAIVYSLSKSQALPLLQRRIAEPRDGDDIFVRRRILKIFEQELLAGRHVDIHLPWGDVESSPFVRQKTSKLAFLLRKTDGARLWTRFVLEDQTPQVRAASLLSAIEVECDVNDTVDFLDVVVQSLKQEGHPFVLRVACHVVTELLGRVDQVVSETTKPDHRLLRKRATIHAFYRQRIEPVLRDRQCNDEQTPARRWIAQTRERAWALMDPQAAELIRWLRPIMPTIKPGTTQKAAEETV